MLKNTLSGETITKTLYLKLYNNNADQPRIFKPNLYRINLTYANPAATKKSQKLSLSTVDIFQFPTGFLFDPTRISPTNF